MGEAGEFASGGDGARRRGPTRHLRMQGTSLVVAALARSGVVDVSMGVSPSTEAKGDDHAYCNRGN